MDVGIVGLGRMGGGIARRLVKAGHRVVAYNRSHEKTEEFAKLGGVASGSLQELVASLPTPRVVFVYLPSGDIAEAHLAELRDLLAPGDILADGGNSQFRKSIAQAEQAKANAIVTVILSAAKDPSGWRNVRLILGSFVALRMTVRGGRMSFSDVCMRRCCCRTGERATALRRRAEKSR